MKLVKETKSAVKVALVKASTKCVLLKELLEKRGFKAQAGEILDLLSLENTGVVYLGLGDRTPEDLRLAGFKLVKFLEARKIKSVNLDFGHVKTLDTIYLVEGFYHGIYLYNRYRADKTQFLPEIGLGEFADEKEVLTELKNLADSIFLCRDLINTPANDLYPANYAELIKETFKPFKDVEVTVFDKKQMQEHKLFAALAVGSGSDNDPRFVVIKYQPNKADDEFLSFVGKGITYDSGGYALKIPYTNMLTMKTDMSGSAAVVSAILALAKNKVKQNVCGVMSLCENAVSGHAYKNGDVFKTHKDGVTIQVDNTDAEGRVSMADSIHWAATEVKSKSIVEFSTLTGACIVSLGTDISGCVSYHPELTQKVIEAGEEAGERIWQFPISKKHEEAVKGTFGTIKNVCSGGAGSITAGIFLTYFSEKVPYVHVDIAGTAYNPPYLYYADGASGVGVRTIYNFVKNSLKK